MALIKSIQQTLVLAVVLVTLLSYQFMSAQTWSAPTATAPSGNATAPLNIGGTYQAKLGDLGAVRMRAGEYCDAAGLNCSTPGGGDGVQSETYVSCVDTAISISGGGGDQITRINDSGKYLVIYNNPASAIVTGSDFSYAFFINATAGNTVRNIAAQNAASSPNSVQYNGIQFRQSSLPAGALPVTGIIQWLPKIPSGYTFSTSGFYSSGGGITTVGGPECTSSVGGGFFKINVTVLKVVN